VEFARKAKETTWKSFVLKSLGCSSVGDVDSKQKAINNNTEMRYKKTEDFMLCQAAALSCDEICAKKGGRLFLKSKRAKIDFFKKMCIKMLEFNVCYLWGLSSPLFKMSTTTDIAAHESVPLASPIPRSVLIIFGLILQIFISGPVFGWPVLLAIIKQKTLFVATDEQYDYIYVGMLVSRLFMNLVQSFINDRFGQRILLLMSLLFSGVGCGLLAFANDRYPMWMIGYILYGIAANGTYLSVMTLSKQLFPNTPNAFIAICNGCLDLGTLWFYVLNVGNIQPMYFFIAVMVISFVSIPLAIFWPSTKKSSLPNDTTSIREYFDCLKKHMMTKEYAFYFGNHIITYFWMSAIYGSVFYRYQFHPELGDIRSIVSIFSVIVGLMGFVLSFLIGPVLERVGMRRMWLIMFVGFMTWTLVLILPPSIPTIIIAIVLFSIARALYYPVTIAFVGSTFGYDVLGRLVSITAFFTGAFTFIQSPLLHACVAAHSFWLSNGLQISLLLMTGIFVFIVK